MGYPEDHLAAGEKLIINARPHWKRLIGSGLLFVLRDRARSVAVRAHPPSKRARAETASDDPDHSRLAGRCRVVGRDPLHQVVYHALRDHRPPSDVPVRRLHSDRHRHPDGAINSVQFRHGVIDHMFKTGTLVIESASDDPLEFDDIPNIEACTSCSKTSSTTSCMTRVGARAHHRSNWQLSLGAHYRWHVDQRSSHRGFECPT